MDRPFAYDHYVTGKNFVGRKMDCNILGNLLDNALNASLQQNKGEINVTIQTIEDTFTIHITNTCNSAEIKTSPKDIDSIDFIHGYGLLNVKKTIAQYDGICVIQCENNIYSVTTIIPL